MNQRELVEKVASVLRTSGIAKKVPSQKKTFTITSQDGQSKAFSIIEPPRETLFTPYDVQNIVTALVDVLQAAVRSGDRVKINGLGMIRAKFRDEVVRKDPQTGKLRIIKSHYAPKMQFAEALKRSAREYAEHLREVNLGAEAIVNTDIDDEYYEEYKDDGVIYDDEYFGEELNVKEILDAEEEYPDDEDEYYIPEDDENEAGDA